MREKVIKKMKEIEDNKRINLARQIKEEKKMKGTWRKFRAKNKK